MYNPYHSQGTTDELHVQGMVRKQQPDCVRVCDCVCVCVCGNARGFTMYNVRVSKQL